MKPINRKILFFKIWAVHLWAYYIPFLFAYHLLGKGPHNEFENLILSPVLGLMGFEVATFEQTIS